MIFEEQPLSSDLEWMLESGQVGKDLLALALVNEFYAPLYRLSSAALRDGEAAAFTTVASFIQALLSVHIFRGAESARVWFFRLASREIGTALQEKKHQQHPFEAELPSRNAGEEASPDSASESTGELILRELANLDWDAFRVVFLFFGLGWEISEIAQVNKKNEGSIQAVLAAFRRRISPELQRIGRKDTGNLDGLVKDALDHGFPAPGLDTASLDRIAALVFEEAQKRSASLGWSFRLREIALVGLAILVVAGLFWGLNTFIPDLSSTPQPSQVAMLAPARKTPSPRSAILSPTPSAIVFYLPSQGETIETAAAKIGADPQELARLNLKDVTATLDFGEAVYLAPEHLATLVPYEAPSVFHPRLFADLTVLDEVKLQQHMLESRFLWRSVWLNAWDVDYGPAGYIGPPRVQWLEVWANQPGQSLEVLTDESNPYKQWTLHQDGRAYHSMGMGSSSWTEVSHGILASSPLRDLIFPARSKWLAAGSHLRIDGEEVVAYRKALAVDWLNLEGIREYRLWIDVETGLVLRMLQYGGPDYGTLIREVVVNTIGLDMESVPHFFQGGQAWKAFLARDISQVPHGRSDSDRSNWLPAPGHQPLPVVLPPEDYDPAGGRLTIQYPLDLNQQQLVYNSRPVVYIYSGGYYLGSLQMPYGPFATICDRTQDGKWVAFAGDRLPTSGRLAAGNVPLSWFPIADVRDIRTTERPVVAIVMAFSPDNRQLAFSGLVGPGDQTGVYLLSLSTGRLTMLRENVSALDIAWSQTGDRLAWVSIANGLLEWTVVDMADRSTVYQETSEIDPGTFMYMLDSVQAPPSMETNQWGIDFPVFDRGLSGCLEQPEQ